jgi:hypothetical protein
MDLLPQLLVPLVIIGVIAYLFARRNREGAANAPLRAGIGTGVCFETTFDRASVTGKGVLGGTLGGWIPLRGTKRLVVGTDAFMISAPQSLREYVFIGREASIGVSQAPSRLVVRDWIVIIGQARGREVQLAIAPDDLLDAWQALAATGAALLSDEPSADQLTRPQRAKRYSLRWLAAALMIVLVADAAAWLGAIALHSLGGAANWGLFVALVMFVVWFYRARVNAEGRGWLQRQSRIWTIMAWFVPIVNFWLPFQIMTDIWRAGLPTEARANRAILTGIWWTCLLALFLASAAARAANQVWYAAIPTEISGALAAIMTAVLVWKVSSGPLGQ